MHLARFLVRGSLAAAGILAAATPGWAEAPRCELLHDGIEYRAFLPDQNRYLYADVKVLPGLYPSVFVIVDKNYLGSAMAGDPVNRWWIDRSKPMQFSGDSVKLAWKTDGTWTAMTSWISSPDTGEIAQPFRGLTKTASGFAGTGSQNTNAFAFETRLEASGFNGDEFDVILPAITYDGVTLTPPVIHFTREDRKTITTKC